jgi:hypothetical protein
VPVTVLVCVPAADALNATPGNTLIAAPAARIPLARNTFRLLSSEDIPYLLCQPSVADARGTIGTEQQRAGE